MVAVTALDNPAGSEEFIERGLEILDTAVGMPGDWVGGARQKLKLSDGSTSLGGADAVPQAHGGTT